MNRDIFEQLVAWKTSSSRKPLVLNGARQVGKTYILNEFGRREYQQLAYVNLDKNAVAREIFRKDYDTRRIILSLSALLHINISPLTTLIVLDEIQESPEALASLKYFCEDSPQYHIVVAGSLLGLSLHSNTSFPVGKVNMLRMYPMTFCEFLEAIGEVALLRLLRSNEQDVIAALSTRYIDCLRKYYYVGGMPAAVQEFANTQDLIKVREIQKQILYDYRRDFSKHAPVTQVPRINMVWDNIPSQLAKENKKFIYGALKKGGRATEFEIAIQWLLDAGLIYKIHRVNSPSLPLKFYEDMQVFKLFMLDVGLFGAMTDTPASEVLVTDNAFVEYKGAFTELYVVSQIMEQGLPIYYYSSNDSRVEIDLIVQQDARIIPMEVKAEVNVKAKSLRTFIAEHPQLHGVRLSMLGYQQQEWMTNIPLYAPPLWCALNTQSTSNGTAQS